MCFAEPNMLNPQVFAERKFVFMRRVFWYTSPDETAFIGRDLRAQMANSGFREIKITPFDWLHPATPAALIPMVLRAAMLLERLKFVQELAGSLLISGRGPSV